MRLNAAGPEAVRREGPAEAGPSTYRLNLPLTLQTENDDPQPQVLFTCGFSNLKPAASSVST